MGAGAGEIPLPSGGSGGVAGPLNGTLYRITAADRLGEGSPKEKFERNAAAIRLLRDLDYAGRAATAEEKAVLVKYSGWGGLPQAFATAAEAPKWKAEQAALKELLRPEEYASARATVLNSHYTSPLVIESLYAALARLGFAHGRVLEPACGLGHFIGLMPDDMRGRSPITGIEIDPLTARLAKALYPDAEIRAQPFEAARLPTNYFDLAISNVPFGDYAPFDPKLNPRKFRIHDYFFPAALARVRPGGLVVFITTRGTMDKVSPTVRETIAADADLVGAVRLPNTAFQQIANTRVTTDILFLRKRMPGDKPSGQAWLQAKPLDLATGETVPINEYFHRHPHHLLGRMELLENGMYGRSEPTLAADGRDLGEALAGAIATLPPKIYQPLTAAQAVTFRQSMPAPEGVKPGAYVLTEEAGGGLARREGDELVVLTDIAAQTARRIRGLIRVRDTARACLRAQVEDQGDYTIDAERHRLNQVYDQFVGQFGPVSETANIRAFTGDPDLPLLLSLENYDEDAGTATKTAIFRERTVQRKVPVERAGTAKEALVVTLNERARVDLQRIEELLGRPPAEFLPELRGTVFLNPETKRWETEDDYLSGNVRDKLLVAEKAAKRDARFRENAEALRAVQPADLKATEIDARLGSVWIPAEDISRFARSLLRVPAHSNEVNVNHVPAAGLWTVEASHFAKTGVANRTEWGTERSLAHELIEDALNQRTPTVYDYDSDGKATINVKATEAAREKQQKIKDRFAEWIWEDDERRARLAAAYNREFNCVRLRTFNGDHLTLPGASPAIVLRPHQKAAVWRILQTPNTLLAHVVGSGKTYTTVAAAMELKRLGLARKPMFVVPNYMLGQFSGELLTLYPNANILAAGKADFESSRRRELMGRIATNNWDAVIVTHSGFERLPLSAGAQKKFFEEQIANLEACIRETAEGSGARIVKQLEAAKKRLEFKLKNLAAVHRKDNTLTFEELGIDRLFVDEAHAYKNLFYVTKMTRVAGLPQAASERAFDMFLKVQHVQRLNEGGGVVFATGTPVTNTMAEMFTLQRFLQMDVLVQRRLQHFDSWAATFGESVCALELAPDGAGYRLNTRFARFVNVPELMHLFRQTADIQTADMLKLPVPALESGRARVVTAKATPQLTALVHTLAERAARLKTGSVPPSEDNMLKITGEGRKAALDLRLVLGAMPDNPEFKVNHAAREIFAVWQESKEQRLAQLVFCDLSTPKPGGREFSVYDDLKTKLVANGVPAAEIAFIQEHDSDAAKTALFKDVRSGRVRILMGSTQKMGAGMNVQTKLVALHHLDAPWRPADIEQREGRILRQGNGNATVRILRYVTAGSFDAYMWQTLETKAKFISQIMTGECTARRIEDLESPALTYAEVKAIASGNPLVIEKAKIDSEVMRLSRMRGQHDEDQYNARRRLHMMEEDVVRLEKAKAGYESDLRQRAETRGDAFKIMLVGRSYDQRAEAGAMLVGLVDRQKSARGVVELGNFAGFRVEFRPMVSDKVTLRGAMSYDATVTGNPLGVIMSLEHAARSIEERITGAQETLVRTRQNIAQMTALIGRPFEHEARFKAAVARQAELVQALDLTKNQNTAGLAADVEAPAVAASSEATAATLETKTNVVVSIGATSKKSTRSRIAV
jgi:N12 class adenine-specific DNA methylase